MGELSRAGVSIGSRWASGSLIVWFCIWSPLGDLRGSRFLERLAFLAHSAKASMPVFVPKSVASW